MVSSLSTFVAHKVRQHNIVKFLVKHWRCPRSRIDSRYPKTKTGVAHEKHAGGGREFSTCCRDIGTAERHGHTKLVNQGDNNSKASPASAACVKLSHNRPQRSTRPSGFVRVVFWSAWLGKKSLSPSAPASTRCRGCLPCGTQLPQLRCCLPTGPMACLSLRGVRHRTAPMPPTTCAPCWSSARHPWGCSATALPAPPAATSRRHQ